MKKIKRLLGTKTTISTNAVSPKTTELKTTQLIDQKDGETHKKVSEINVSMMIPLKKESVKDRDSRTMATQLIQRAVTKLMKTLNPFKPTGETKITVNLVQQNSQQSTIANIVASVLVRFKV